MILDGIYYYPDGSRELFELLQSFEVLHERQIASYFMKRYDGWTMDRVKGMLKSLLDIRAIVVKKGFVSMKSDVSVNENRILAFWILLKYMDKYTIFDVASYPGEIVFTEGDDVYEIIVADEELPKKLAFLQRRYKGYENTKIDIAMKDIIADIDLDALPDENICFTVYEKRKLAPKFTKHDFDVTMEDPDELEEPEDD